MFDIVMIFLWEVATNNKRLSMLISTILQTSSVKIWAESIHWFTSYSVWKQSTSEFSCKDGKRELRVLIKHSILLGKTLSESKAKLDKYYSNSALSYGIFQKWFIEFHCGRTRRAVASSFGALGKFQNSPPPPSPP